MINKRVYSSSCVSAIFALIFILSGCKDDDPEHFGEGSGTRDDPFLIETAEDLNNVRNSPDKHFKQIADIDLVDFTQGSGWLPIGDEETRFTGSYNGNGHTITNLTINLPDEDYVGLFGFAENSTIENINLEISGNVTGSNYVGGLVGKSAGSGFISNIYVEGQIEGNDYAGGLAGWNECEVTENHTHIGVSTENTYGGGLIGWNEGNISNSKAEGGAHGSGYIGGFTGMNKGDITESYAGEGAWGENDYIGGFAGWNEGDITDSRAEGSYQGNSKVGGFAGKNTGNISSSHVTGYVEASLQGSDTLGGMVGINKGSITKSYAEASISGEEECVGGLAGINKGSISQCYATGDATAYDYVGGLTGVNKNSVENTYAIVDVTGQTHTAGLVGINQGSVEKSYAAGEVSTKGDYSSYIGGLAGNCQGEVFDSYYDKNTTGQDDDEGKGIPKTTLEMQQKSTYENWDFDNIWDIDKIHMSYPYFRWE